MAAVYSSVADPATVQRVGVIGGGQLAWMMAKAAADLGIELSVQTPNKTDPAIANFSHPSGHPVFAAVDDAKATAELAQHCQVITFENEFVDLEALSQLATQGICFRPALTALQPLLDKYEQRTYLQKLGLPVPAFTTIGPSTDISTLDFPLVVKSRRHGYDGQGTFILHDAVQLQAFWNDFPTPPSPEAFMAEAFIPFERELAIVAARSITGEVALYPVIETYQHHQVCHWAMAPVALASETQQQIENAATTLLNDLEAVGIFGIELFLTPDGQILVNEIAPRTHNSGHLTLDACATSQFEQHLRAVSGLPLGDTSLTAPGAIMINLLGYEVAEYDYGQKREMMATFPNTFVHWYGKAKAHPGRKLGHVTALLDNPDRQQALTTAKRIANLWYRP
ncbi:N5-carboxyaminoimidazole ribonucleotide synthase [Acaryochloris thomasi RCC1774]|uniref:N5-carboxyaminoimidazole ribonucleotide synthase n=1 Tax=Acaryochloris thomasi RCC1774 TaxID=1764569 RepID=A0A2W1JJC1_9CYAN|nr:5-(carboxyamino)imidazole ribonucleotide synthase [Acaryochloris thomasi]PZD70354.1 N5-carboxyaminoimidazole ribonucleotide synthase [Acaryochloris thomasi RCC1774]